MIFWRSSLLSVLLAALSFSSIAAAASLPRDDADRRELNGGRMKHHLVAKAKTSNIGFDVDKVLDVAKSLTSHSWEFGILFSALLEYYNPSYSVFGSNPFPSGKVPTPSVSNVQALSKIKPNIRTNSTTLADGDGSAGDPASLVVPAVLIGQTDSAYRKAADRQIAHLYAVPRLYNGAISQRESVAEVWADAMYMFPPALAYYAVLTQNQTMLHEAIIQCSRYKLILKANTTESWSGLWTHIIGPQSQTLGIWSTGNGWAAMGMARVLATVKGWNTSSGWTTQQNLLKGWIYEILKGAKATGTASNGLLKNYLVGGPNGQSQMTNKGDFGDVTGTAMLASVVYRMAVMDPTGAKSYLSWADSLRQSVRDHVGTNGYAVPTVDPLNWFNTSPQYGGSPEGQSAVGIMAAAWRDCVSAGRC